MSNSAHITAGPAGKGGAQVAAMQMLDRVYSPNTMSELVVSCRRNIGDADERTYATSDGRPVLAEWATQESGDVAYFEAFDRYGVAVSHGYVDAQSRQIVQVG